MAFADRICIVENDETRRVEADFAARFKALSGFDYPPKDQAEWTIVLTRAGFSQARVEQFLNEIGFTGFDDCGELPRGYVSAPHGEWPIFSVLMTEGLERWEATNRPARSPSVVADGKAATSDQFASEGLAERHFAILQLLKSKAPAVLAQAIIAAELDVEDRKTVRKELNILRQRGLIDRPESKKRGDLITNLGRRVAERLAK